MTLEDTGLWRWLFLFIYVRGVSFPWIGLALHLEQWRTLFPVPLMVFWIVQTLVVLIYAHQYYPLLKHSLFHALVLPMFVMPWFLLCIYAKTFWRGYQGTRPAMQWPSLDPPTLSLPISLTPSSEGSDLKEKAHRE